MMKGDPLDIRVSSFVGHWLLVISARLVLAFESALFASIVVALLSCPKVSAQDRQPPPLRLSGVQPGGVRTSATESWGTFDFSLDNLSDSDRQARVLVFYEGRPDVQYGRDVWLPARSSLSTWMLVGPAPAQAPSGAREIDILLYDRSEGQDRLILPPGPGRERVRSRLVLYRKREPYTAIMLDEDAPEAPIFGQLPQPESRAAEAVHFARTFRSTRKLSEFVQIVNPGFLAPTAEAFDGIDHFVLASGRIGRDPAGMQALRQWLERGGKVWVMLDLVEPEVVAHLLGDALDFQVVDRVSLTTFKIQTPPTGQPVTELPVQQHEQPVDFVRVLLPAPERAQHIVNGWPVWFTRPVGRGKIVFTTLGPRGWYRPRTRTDPPSPYQPYPALPVPTEPLIVMAGELQPAPEEDPFRIEAFRPALTKEIGYAVVGPGKIGLVFGAFLLATLALGLALRKSHRPELLGWLVPAAALGSAGVFIFLGDSSRRAALPTVAVGQIVDAVSGKEETAVHGLLAAYRPDSGPAEVGAGQGGFFDLDMTGLEGQSRRLILTDVNAWHWENLALPAGVRVAPFRYTAPTGVPLKAVAHFGPEGLEGETAAGPFRDLADALLWTPSGRNLSVRLRPDGTFSAGSQDILPPGQFLASALLLDRHQRRQELYRDFLKRPAHGRLAGRNLLLVWAEPIDMHFTLAPEAAMVGDALLIIPLELKRPAPGALVTIPGPLIPYRRIMERGAVRPVLESDQSLDMHLRFQLPETVLPLKVERARLVAKIDAPSRRVTIAGRTDGGLFEVHRIESPLDPIRVDITEERLLRLDEEGGLHLNVALSDLLKADEAGQGGFQASERWTIEYLELEVTGRTVSR